MPKPETIKLNDALTAAKTVDRQKEDAVLDSKAISVKDRKEKELVHAFNKIKKREDAIAILMKEEKMEKKEKEDFDRYEEALLLSYALTQPTIKETPTPKPQDSKPVEKMNDDEILDEIKKDPILKKEIDRLKDDALKHGVKIEDKTIVQKYRTTHDIARLNSLQNQPLKPSEIMAQNRLAAQNKPLLRPDITNQIQLARANKNVVQPNTLLDNNNRPQQSTLKAAPNSRMPNPSINSSIKNQKISTPNLSPRPTPKIQAARDSEKKETKQIGQTTDRKELMNKQLLSLQNPSAKNGTGLLTPSQIKKQNRQTALNKSTAEQVNPATRLSTAPNPHTKHSRILKEAAALKAKHHAKSKQNGLEKDKYEPDNKPNLGKTI